MPDTQIIQPSKTPDSSTASLHEDSHQMDANTLEAYKRQLNQLCQEGLPNHSVICLMAPTASGKTALAYELYDTGRFEIISVDSALIYKDMNIGTAKPTEDELGQYPHHLVNIITPEERYSVASFVSDVEMLIDKIHKRGKIPLLVGGTMMYYMALFTGLSPVPETDFAIREEVEAWREQQGISALYAYLQQVDPQIASRLKVGDTQRITRAVEVYKQTGKPLSEWQQLPKVAIADNPNQLWLGFAVMPERTWLHERIKLRLDVMWQSGLVDEVIGLLTKYRLTPEMPSMRCVGYRQVLEYLIKADHPSISSWIVADGGHHSTKHNIIKNTHPQRGKLGTSSAQQGLEQKDIACQDMKNKALYATRQLAKRQYTWLRNLSASHGVPKSCIAKNGIANSSKMSLSETDETADKTSVYTQTMKTTKHKQSPNNALMIANDNDKQDGNDKKDGVAVLGTNDSQLISHISNNNNQDKSQQNSQHNNQKIILSVTSMDCVKDLLFSYL